ncbi:hypothetical protein CVT24_008428 [Panaeolus cyanescens]|uniref:Yeast cell wall synthesis Kre9/Knh1-like N-terminal domain-containing protein n=1 Tax=Panaeolus cyanescens TaxID=181874 RepID=A0A409VD05_9AGAR|nr:hypothetical protein CVT24_008428 [Panaeolus cyanescens]
MKFFTAVSTLLAAFAVSAALPAADLEVRDVFVPPITSPTAGAIWTLGQTQTVTWDTSNAPVNITNKNGVIRLRRGGLTSPLILAKGFNILDGSVEVTVPLVVESTDYSIVLFGDSGNFSPQFTITGSGIIG